eukprot:m.32385 g.32385  ORF g.32385 m.32385 type:complete len:56 (+) comp42325_c0_seq2:943-1110(+)
MARRFRRTPQGKAVGASHITLLLLEESVEILGVPARGLGQLALFRSDRKVIPIDG